MEEIGLKLREMRISNGVSVEEAAADLRMRPSQIENLENGKREEFKDVGMLKYFIRDYAKYLGMDGDSLVDEFNEYLFDFTSKIPIDEIEKAKENVDEKKEVVSPYTRINKKKNHKVVIGVIIILVIAAVIAFLLFGNRNASKFIDDDTTYVIRR